MVRSMIFQSQGSCGRGSCGGSAGAATARGAAGILRGISGRPAERFDEDRSSKDKNKYRVADRQSGGSVYRRGRVFERRGATTVATCLANEYARSGARTILVDGCADSRTLSQELAAGKTIKAKPKGRQESEPAIPPGALTLALLPSAESDLQPNETNRRLIERMAEVISESRLKFERIIVDLPALLSSDHWKRSFPTSTK